jgi:hypothetical protein
MHDQTATAGAGVMEDSSSLLELIQNCLSWRPPILQEKLLYFVSWRALSLGHHFVSRGFVEYSDDFSRGLPSQTAEPSLRWAHRLLEQASSFELEEFPGRISDLF